MTDLLSLSQKSGVHSILADIHDTFSRSITIYKMGDYVEFVSDDSDYNPIYGRDKDSKSSTPELIAHSTKVRIKYFAEHELGEESQERSNLGIELSYGDVRLKMDEEAYLLVKGSSRIDIDGQPYKTKSDVSRSGPFNADYYIMYLQRSD